MFTLIVAAACCISMRAAAQVTPDDGLATTRLRLTQLENRLHRLQIVVNELGQHHMQKKSMVRWLADRHEQLGRSTPVELLVNDFGTSAVQRYLRETLDVSPAPV